MKLFAFLFFGLFLQGEQEPVLTLPSLLEKIPQATRAEKTKTLLKEGKVFWLEPRKDRKRKQVWMFQLLDSTPEEAAAAYLDWDLGQELYADDGLIETIVGPKTHEDREVAEEIRFIFKIPIPFAGNEDYTVVYRTRTLFGGKIFRITSRLVPGSGKWTKEIDRTIWYAPFPRKNGKKRTLMAYSGFTDPGNPLATDKKILKAQVETYEKLRLATEDFSKKRRELKLEIADLKQISAEDLDAAQVDRLVQAQEELLEEEKRLRKLRGDLEEALKRVRNQRG